MDDAMVHRPASRTFYLLDTRQVDPAVCGPSKVIQEFGAPAEIVVVDDYTQLFVYDRDITSSLKD